MPTGLNDSYLGVASRRRSSLRCPRYNNAVLQVWTGPQRELIITDFEPSRCMYSHSFINMVG
jgi:hypothetical protein